MADLNRLIDRLNELADPSAWDKDRSRERSSATAGAYTLHVDRMPDGTACWQVEHERLGVILPWTPKDTVRNAMKEALAFSRAHAQGAYEPKHIEA